MAETLRSIKGLAQLQAALDKLPGLVQEKLVVKGVSQGARVIQDEMKRLAPVRAGGGLKKDSKGRLREPGNLRRNITRRRVKRGSGTTVTYQIGPNRRAFYGLFLELGTRHAGKHPFMRPALDSKQSEAVNRMAEVIRAGLPALVREARGG